MDNQEDRVNNQEDRMDDISSEVDILNSKSIVEDFFWTNPETFVIPQRFCFDKIDVEANETFDFSANLSLVYGDSPVQAWFYAWLRKDDVQVAQSGDDRGMIAHGRER